MNLDPKELIEKLGGEAKVAALTHEQRADALEDFQTQKLNDAVSAKAKANFPTVAELDALIDKREYRRGEGKLFAHPTHNYKFKEQTGTTVRRLPGMPAKPTLVDFFKLRFDDAAHLLQSGALAMRKGLPEETILACMLHDLGSFLMKAEHGYFSAQLIEPYVSEKVAFAVRYHQALRFFPDASVNYEYPTGYYKTFGIDYVPTPYITAEYEMARKHKWYMEARLVTLNDLYAFDPKAVVYVEQFEDIIGRHFRMPEEGLGYDHTPVSHMWRAMINPDAPL
jgi:hypothetical protein